MARVLTLLRARSQRRAGRMPRVLAAAGSALLLVLPGLPVAGAPPVFAGSPSTTHVSPASHMPPPGLARRACAIPTPGRASCNALVRTDVAARPASVAAVTPSSVAGYHPADLQDAYGLAAAAAGSGSGVTVAVIDAYDDPTAESDLALYRSTFSLPPCTTANGCFHKVNQRGQASPLPATDTSGWSVEISLDLDMVSAICPNCSILLVEADSSYLTDLGAAVNYAASAGAKYISNSYGGPEDSTAPTLDTLYYKHAGVVVTASTGDWGYQGYQAGAGQTGNEYPSVSPWVVAVGGTTLGTAGNSRGWTESAWSGAGSGCSVYEAAPTWQSSAMTGCPRRMAADVSAVADPNTGVSVASGGSFYMLGGTSAAAPIIAATYALAGAPNPGSWPGAYPYGRGGLFDVVGGSNAGSGCSPALWCNGVAGYDGPTGLGTPNGVTPLTAPTAPGAPTSVSASPGNASLVVGWAAPASNGGSPITGYTATASPGGASCTGGSTATSCTIGGLSNGTTYAVTVTATSAAGTGPASNPPVSETPRTVPGQPQGVSATAGDGQVQVSWSAPSSDGGSAITGYAATASPGGATCASVSSPCTIAGLANGQPYTLTVSASNVAGAGAASSPSAQVTPRTIPGAPTGVISQIGNGSVRVSWTAPAWNGGAPISAYTVTASPDGQTCSWASGSLECTVPGLVNGTAYTFTVTAANAAGSGPASGPSAPATPQALPGEPTGVLVRPAAPTLGALAVTWTAPADDGGSPITSYTATAFDSGSFTAVGSCTSSGGTPAATACSITGLAQGEQVVVRVAATTALGTGLASGATSPTLVPVAPAAAVAALPNWALGSFGVRWSQTAGSNPIVRYDVRYRRIAWNGSAWIWLYPASTAGSGLVQAATPGTTYCFSVRPHDAAGFVAPAWSAEQCTGVPLDDRSLARLGRWSIGTGIGSAFFRGTWTRSSSYGAKVYRTSIRARRLAVVATTCPSCGNIRVYLGSTVLRTISLYSATTRYRQVIPVAAWSSVRAGTVTIKLTTSGRRVVIDGLGVAQF